MPSTSLHELIPVLQIAVGPVILISGIGLLLLTLNARVGRIIDRSRELVRQKREAPSDQQQLAGQIDILYRRARLVRLSITAAALAILLASVLIIALFLTALMKCEAGLFISIFFTGCLLALIVSVVAFIKDTQLSLGALALELGRRETVSRNEVGEAKSAWLANV
jgi:Cu/Ag efflux pump CusA